MGAHGSDGGKTQQVVTPLWTTPQLDKFIKGIEERERERERKKEREKQDLDVSFLENL